jgi:sterol desaturase/sphingolipid hydroxylase (fatty acid hydroxylase superfamily)
MNLEALTPAFILGFFGLGLVLERVAAARPLPQVKGWHVRAWVFFVLSMAVNALAPLLVVTWIGAHAPLHLSHLGTWKGGLIALVVGDLASYLVHRLQHTWPWLWRWTHQLHHSAERVDVLGAAYNHPFDLGMQAIAGALAIGALGVTPNAAALAGILMVAMAVFQHLNVRTPQWLGYLVQRPEAHTVHHTRGVHGFNYGNLGLWDLVFQTFRNPKEFAPIAGFWDGASAKVWAMLLGRDVGTAGQ